MPWTHQLEGQEGESWGAKKSTSIHPHMLHKEDSFRKEDMEDKDARGETSVKLSVTSVTRKDI